MCWGVGAGKGGLGKCRERCGKVCWGVKKSVREGVGKYVGVWEV